MEIMQVMGTLVCTFRVAGLDHMHLRILKNNKGKNIKSQFLEKSKNILRAIETIYINDKLMNINLGN